MLRAAEPVRLIGGAQPMIRIRAPARLLNRPAKRQSMATVLQAWQAMSENGPRIAISIITWMRRMTGQPSQAVGASDALLEGGHLPMRPPTIGLPRELDFCRRQRWTI